MDAYKKLKLEIRGVRAVIEQYSDEGNIANCIKGLEDSLEIDDFESVLYYLNEVCIWYHKNIERMYANPYVYNLDDHERNKRVLDEIKVELENYDFSEIIGKAYSRSRSKK